MKLENVLFALMFIVFYSACGGSGNNNQDIQEIVPNVSPTVSTADDFSVNESIQVNLTAQANDSDGSIQTVLWIQVTGITVELTNTDSLNTSFTAPNVEQDEVLIFQITVTDNDGATATDQINVTINDVAGNTDMFSLGGQLTGANANLTLILNDDELLELTGNGHFTFQTELSNGANYLVRIEQSPAGQNCSIDNSEGIVESTITNINISCQTITSNICSDGIDNDNDGLVDWQEDLGCTSQTDNSEGGLTTHEIENGWSVIEPSPDTIIYYVSSSEGNDDNDGLSSSEPFESYARAFQLARENQPDWILLKRGDTFAEDIQIRSGRSANEPFVISSYGESTSRPLILTGANDGLNFNGDFAFISVLGLDFYANTRNPEDISYVDSSGGYGFRIWREDGSRGNNILIENCAFRYFVLSLIQGQTPPENITIRRNIMEYNYATASHSQGVFSRDVINLIFDENIMDHNGWLIQSFDEGQSAGQATKFNHNTYFNSINGLRYKNNAIMRGASMGSKFTAQTEANDLNIENNLYLDNEIAIGMGQNYDHQYRFKRISITNNLVTNMGLSRPTNRVLGWGIQIDGLDDSLINNNFIVNSPTSQVTNTFALEVFPGMRNIDIRDNTMDGISAGNSRGLIRLYGDASQENVILQNNEILASTFERVLVETDESSFQNISFEANTYFSMRDSSTWFELNNNDISYQEWIAETAETDSSSQLPNHCDNGRSIEAYQSSIDEESSIDGFITNIKQQGKFHWDTRYNVPTVNAWIKNGYQSCK